MGKRLVKSPKLYFMDTGLLLYLLGIREPRDLANSPLLGSIFETLTLGQIVRYHANKGLREDIYFYRDSHGHEIDFLVPRGDTVHAIECKWMYDISKAADVFRSMEKIFPAGMVHRKTIISSQSETVALSEDSCMASCVDPGNFLE